MFKRAIQADCPPTDNEHKVGCFNQVSLKIAGGHHSGRLAKYALDPLRPRSPPYRPAGCRAPGQTQQRASRRPGCQGRYSLNKLGAVGHDLMRRVTAPDDQAAAGLFAALPSVIGHVIRTPS